MTARGIALDRLSRHAEAQEVYKRGLTKNPTDFALLSNLGLSYGLSGKTDEGIRILRELVRDGAATANTRGNLALVYGLAGREREAQAALAGDLSGAQIQNNLAYYRELRGMLLAGRPIGNIDQPAQARAQPAAAPRPRSRPPRRRRPSSPPAAVGSRRPRCRSRWPPSPRSRRRRRRSRRRPMPASRPSRPRPGRADRAAASCPSR